MKRLLAIGTVIIIIGITFFFARREKIIEGQVVDCNTSQPITGAVVLVNQRGWGIRNNNIVWDNNYQTQTHTDQEGHFKLSFHVGSSANIIVNKDGYLDAHQYEYPGTDIIVGLKQGLSSIERTYRCKLASECLETTYENGVQVSRDVCN